MHCQGKYPGENHHLCRFEHIPDTMNTMVEMYNKKFSNPQYNSLEFASWLLMKLPFSGWQLSHGYILVLFSATRWTSLSSHTGTTKHKSSPSDKLVEMCNVWEQKSAKLEQKVSEEGM